MACDEVQRVFVPSWVTCVPAALSGIKRSTCKACTRDGECQAGTLRPYCIPTLDPGGAGDTGWVDGYCTGVDCRMGECGPEGVCLGVNEQGQTACFLRCELERQDCRMGYSCVDIGFGDIAICGPR